MTGLNLHRPFEEMDRSTYDEGFVVGWCDHPHIIVLYVEGCVGAEWTPAETREAARRLNLMADEADPSVGRMSTHDRPDPS